MSRRRREYGAATYELDYNANLTRENAGLPVPEVEVTIGEPKITGRTPFVPKSSNVPLFAGLGLLAAAAWMALS